MSLRDNRVELETGRLEGVASADGDVHVFRGVPYAQPPVGALRWRPPQPAVSWDGVRPARNFATCCVQPPRPQGSISNFGIEQQDEDCLYLNIWTAASSSDEKRPVMLWLHGGGFSYGSGSLPLFDGEGLARRGVVLVTINYRLGPLGYLAHPELSRESAHGVSGNYGLLDQIESLRWVQANIHQFGGDPGCVTIFGQSVGSSSVSCLLASPLAKGLFHRAICQSGGSVGPVGNPGGGSMQMLDDAHKRGVEFVQSLGARSIAEMREKPASAIQLPPPEALDDPWMVTKANQRLRNSGWIIIDGHAIPTNVFEIFKNGRQNDVPLMTGSNSHEGSTSPAPATKQSYIDQCSAIYRDDANELLSLYGVREAADFANVARLINGHRTFNWQNWTTLRLHASTAKSAAFGYYFNRLPPFPAKAKYSDNANDKLGAFHTAEIPYAFDHLSVRDWPWQDRDRELANIMSAAWVRFARTGDPNGDGAPQWPRYNAQSPRIMLLGEIVDAAPMPLQAELAFWDRWFAKERGAA